MAEYRLCQLIEKKRDGKVLEEEELGFFVEEVKKLALKNEEGVVDRCQIGAMLMAMYLNGLNELETHELTSRMKDSGDIFFWPEEFQSRVVDKHSTGGVGDKISLVLVPALAACNLIVPMVSGRSLAHTGGTLDKLEAVRGLSVQLSSLEIREAIATVGCCIVGQTDQCVPADKVLYECRALTATVNYPPLITASIVSKKLSVNPSALVFDVKFGRGSLFKSPEEALETAKGLVKASQPVKAVALLTSMEAPIGRAVGDVLEVLEAVECLRGNGPPDVKQIVEALGSELLRLTGGGGAGLSASLEDGRALKRFHDMLMQQQVGEEAAADLCYGTATKAFKESPPVHVSYFKHLGEGGYVSSVDPLVFGRVWQEEYSFSRRNPRVGFLLVKSVGDSIQSGDVWMEFHHQRPQMTEDQEKVLHKALQVSLLRIERRLIEKRVFLKDGLVVVEDY